MYVRPMKTSDNYIIMIRKLKVLWYCKRPKINTQFCRIKGCGGGWWASTNNFRKT